MAAPADSYRRDKFLINQLINEGGVPSTILNLDLPSSLRAGLPPRGITGEEKGNGEKCDSCSFVTRPGHRLLQGQAPTHPAVPCPCVSSSSPWVSGAGCQPETSKYSASNKGNSRLWGLPALSLNHSISSQRLASFLNIPVERTEIGDGR